MDASINYKKNLALLKDAALANQLALITANPWIALQTGKKNEWNLKKGEQYIHSPQNIQVEVRQSLGMHDLHGIDRLIIYGLGLGYYYTSLKTWLNESSNHRLIFLEDDLSVIQRFLETETAQDFLSNSQAELIFLDLTDPQSTAIENLAKKLMYQNTLFFSLVSYEKNKAENVSKINFLINFKKSSFQLYVGEYLQRGEPFFKNFYHNLFQFPKSLQGNELCGKFQGVPAIICGAGPSLHKQMELLISLKDKALIFAGGTAMNAINASGLIPHFGVGVDPFSPQFTRLIMNTAFETPFFYRNRMNEQAVEMIHGPKLYLAGASGYPLANWFDEKLGLKHPNIDEGCNVINLSLSIAEALGCNPIICVGLDLAYTSGESYSPGIEMHAIHDKKENLITKSTEEELILHQDINGQPIYTLWKWIQESVWFSQFAYTHPQLVFLNATEGGIGFKGVPNLSLQEVKEQYLTKQYDFESLLHKAFLALSMPEQVNEKHIREVIKEFVESLYNCIEYLKAIYAASPEEWNAKQPKMTDELTALEGNLKKQTAYQTLLKTFDDNYKAYIKISDPSKILNQLSGRFANLLEITVDNLHWIDEVLQKQNRLSRSLEKESVSLKENVQSKQIFKNGLLDGLSQVITNSGLLLADSFYVNGKKEGDAKFFYTNRQLASHQRFHEGIPDGKQEYYYEDGSIKSVIPYNHGKLDGTVYLYFPNKKLQRELTFKESKRNGLDRIYNEFGELIIEAEYRQGKPVGCAKMWYDHGILAKEVTFNEQGLLEKVQQWTKDGQLLPSSLKPLDFFDQVAKQSELLTSAIDQIYQNVSGVFDTFSAEDKENYESMQSGMEDLSKQMEEFKKMSEHLQQESGVAEGAEEPIWKSPSSKKLMQQYLEIMTGNMHETMRTMASELHFLQKKMKEKQSDHE